MRCTLFTDDDTITVPDVWNRIGPNAPSSSVLPKSVPTMLS